jgi:pimeloyl-ACP methyl ester carboxylesterase
MKKLLLVSLFSFFCVPGSHADLVRRFQIELTRVNERTARLNAEDSEFLNQYQFVLVDGILGDFVQDLYTQAVPQLRSEAGLKQISVIRPSTFNSMTQNADQLALEFSRAKKPLIVLAHSRGAAETFLALLKHPELITSGKVARAVLVQGAYSGSPLAEFVQAQLAQLCPNQPISLLRESCEIAGYFKASIHTLVPHSTDQLMRSAAAKLTADERSAFMERVRFVRAQSELTSTRFALMPGAAYFKVYYSDQGPNDGVLFTEKMHVPGLGVDWGVLPADHFGLLGGAESDHSKQFIRATLRELLSEMSWSQESR